jgi:hypothetical protein
MFLLELNRNPPLPVGQLEAHDIFRAFLERQPGNYPQNWSKSVSVEDLKREISALRKALRQAGVDWMPGLRANSLKLPPFTLRAVRTAKN